MKAWSPVFDGILATFAVVIAVLGPSFLFYEIRKHDLRAWQHYACFTVLSIFLSLLLLALGGQLESFGYGSATVRLVNRKVDEVQKLAEEIRSLAKTTAELSVLLRDTPGIGHLAISVDHDALIRQYEATRERVGKLMEQAGASRMEIDKVVEPLTKSIEQFRAERAKELKPPP